MKGIKLKLLLVALMILPVPFSCEDRNECIEFDREPYFSMQDMVFRYVDLYWRNPRTNKLMFEALSQDYDSFVYPSDSLALYFEAPDTALLFHSQVQNKFNFGFTMEAFACTQKRNGWAGTRDQVDQIIVTSNYDFDETHDKNDNLSDIVDIFAYNNTTGKNSWAKLNEFNLLSPYEAPARFYLLIKRKPTRSKVQQFVIKYYMVNQPGEASKYFIITTPEFHLR